MDLYNNQVNIICPPSVFGDGKHETTRFLLYFLNRYAHDKTVIDAGSGSGILSVFAAKCGAKSVTAIDYDKSAAQCTRDNVNRNGVDVDVIQTDIGKADVTADVVTANFARFEVVYLLPHLSKMAKELLITTWYKDVPKDPLRSYEIVDHIEGVEYDCYVLKNPGLSGPL